MFVTGAWQVAAEREVIMAQIEAAACELRSAGACKEWFVDSDPLVVGVCLRTLTGARRMHVRGRWQVQSMAHSWRS